jgi:hypothetical protein
MNPMPIQLPDFQNSRLYALYAVAFFDLSDSSLSRFIKRLDNKKEKREARYETALGMARIQVAVDQKQKEANALLEQMGEMSVQIELESELAQPIYLMPPPHGIDDVQDLVNKLHGEKIHGGIGGAFSIPVNQLPDRGAVRLMLEVSTKIGKGDILLKGAQFLVQNYDPYQEVSWWSGQRGGETNLFVSIGARNVTVVEDDYLENAVQVLTRGLRELVLEESLDMAEAGK